MIRHLPHIAFAVSLALSGCQQNNGGSKRGATGSGGKDGSDQDGKDDEVAEPDADGSKDVAPGDKTFCSKQQDTGHGSLAPYLYTVKEACDVSPWALTYKAASGEVEETRDVMPNSEELRSYIEGFLNRVVKLDLAKPGRQFKVRIMVDDEKNAYADGRQNIVINSGFLKGSIDPERFLGVLCHEMVHSLRNDGTELDEYYTNVLIDDPEKNPKAKTFYDKADAYFAKAYDDGKKTYTHDKAAFDSLNSQWKSYKKDTWIFTKKIEATADVVGGGLCAALGVQVATFRSVFEDLKADEAGQHYRTIEDVQDGEEFELKPEEVYAFVFSDDSHPTYDERINQINRVGGFMQQYLGDDKDLLAEWNTKFPPLVKKVTAGTSLSDEPARLPGEMRVKNLTTGEIESFPGPKSPRGYRHGR